jgi:hypothetical protein
MLVCWLFFNFVTSFDFGCFSLAQEMSFVDHYLPYFRQWLTTHPLSALLPFQSLFTASSCGDQLLAPPPFSNALTSPCTLCCMFLFSSLFIILFIGGARGSVCPGGYAVLSHGWLGELCMMLICSPVGLLNISQAGLVPVPVGTEALLVSQCNMVWAGSSRCRSFDFFWWLFSYQVWLQCLSKIFDLQSSCCLLLYSSQYLGSTLSNSI